MPGIRSAAAGVITITALLLSACSSTTDAGGGVGAERDENAPEWLQDVYANVDAQYEGRYLDVVESGPAAVEGADVWYVSCGEAVSGCAAAGAGFEEAAEVLGWDVTYYDGKFDPNEVSNGIKQAVAAGADAIGINVFDCAAIKTALQQAKDAAIPVVSTWSADCDPSLITAITTFGGQAPHPGIADYSADKIRWAIAQTGGEAKVIDINETDLGSTIAQEKGYREGIEGCPDCETVETVDFTVNTMGNLQSLVSAALTKHPEANVINIPYGGLLPAGIQAALTQAGRTKDMFIVGGACDGGELELMAQGWTIACGGYEQAQTGWMTADYINRLLAGENPADLPAVGIGYQLVDAEHPQDGTEFKLPVDYRAAYKKVWTGK